MLDDHTPCIACIDFPAFPLQCLLRGNPTWRAFPVAVIEADRPQAKLLWVNEHARAHRLLPGMTLAAAQSQCRSLRADVLAPETLEANREELFLALHHFSPRVEPDAKHPGTFWVDPQGLARLYGGLEAWAQAIRDAFDARSLQALPVLGFRRYRCFAIARGRGQAIVLADPQAEAKLASTVALHRLDFPPSLREELALLGVRTFGQFIRLDPSDLHLRFGKQADTLHRLCTGDTHETLAPRPFREAIRCELPLDPPEGQHEGLIFHIKSPLEKLCSRLAERHQALSLLHVTLHLDHADTTRESIEPASATLDHLQLLDLLRLRLGACSLSDPVEKIELEAEGTPAHPHQLQLFRTRQKRDLEAADRALARVRAVFGDESVCVARLRSSHLPEARVQWERLEHARFPSVPSERVKEGPLPLVRQLYARPRPLSSKPSQSPPALDSPLGPTLIQVRESQGLPLDPDGLPYLSLHGPQRINGAWWLRSVARDYYYARRSSGELSWIFYDRIRRRWFSHGYVD